MKPSRRHFLKASGVSLALPWLNAFFPRSALAADAAKPVRRMVCICTPLGLHPSFFFPEKTGKDYESTPYLEVLKDFRSDYTVVSGLSHAGMSPGFAHQASASFLTGVQVRAGPVFATPSRWTNSRPRTSAAETRFPSLALSGEGAGLSWTRTGALVPASTSPSRVFARLFLDGKARRSQSPGDPARRRPQHPRRRPRPGQEVCGPASAPTIATSSTSTSPASASWSSAWPGMKSGARRRSRRSMSSRLKDIPSVADLIGRTRLLFDLTHLALQTDSTRLITIMLAGSTFVPPIPGRDAGPSRPVAPRQRSGQARPAQRSSKWRP